MLSKPRSRDKKRTLANARNEKLSYSNHRAQRETLFSMRPPFFLEIQNITNLKPNLLKRSMYINIASDFARSPNAFQASNLAWPLKSNIPGLVILHGPHVACLYSP